jgi:hypothetical protein
MDILRSATKNQGSLLPMALQPKSGLFILFLRFLDHTQLRHMVGLFWAIDQPVAEASAYTGQHNILV